MFGCVARVRGQLAKLELLGQISCAGIHCLRGIHLWYFRILVEGRVHLAGQINRVLQPWCIRLVRAVGNHVRNDIGAEGLRMNVGRQMVQVIVEASPFATFVTCCEDIFGDGVVLVVVHNTLAVEGVVPYMDLMNNIIAELEVGVAHKGLPQIGAGFRQNSGTHIVANERSRDHKANRHQDVVLGKLVKSSLCQFTVTEHTLEHVVLSHVCGSNGRQTRLKFKRSVSSISR